MDRLHNTDRKSKMYNEIKHFFKNISINLIKQCKEQYCVLIMDTYMTLPFRK